MKKSLFILMMVVVAMVGCKKNTTEEPKTEEPKTEEPKKENNINFLLGQYVGKLNNEENSPEYLQFVFGDGDVFYVPESGGVGGTGHVYIVAVFAESIDASMFPNVGKYTGNDSFEANTFYCTSSTKAHGYTTIYELDNGSIKSDTRILEGTIDISGNSETGEFVFELKDAKGVSHSLYYKGAVPMEAVEN